MTAGELRRPRRVQGRKIPPKTTVKCSGMDFAAEPGGMDKILNIMLKTPSYPEAINPGEKFVDSGVFFFRLRLAFQDELRLHSRRRGGEARKGCLI